MTIVKRQVIMTIPAKIFHRDRTDKRRLPVYLETLADDPYALFCVRVGLHGNGSYFQSQAQAASYIYQQFIVDDRYKNAQIEATREYHRFQAMLEAQSHKRRKPQNVIKKNRRQTA